MMTEVKKKQLVTLNLDVSTYDDHMCFEVCIN